MQLTINGHKFEVSAPYTAGSYELNEAEAKTLNQTRLENIANNLRKQIVALASNTELSDEEKRSQMEALVRAKDEEYTFGMGRQGGGGASVSRDPVAVEARKIASIILDNALKEKDTSLAKQRKVNKEGVEAKLAEIAANPKVIAQAKENVAAMQKSVTKLTNIVGDQMPVAAE